ncbi:MAG: cation:dicarboxylase symporter family transporter, partial [Pseudomonadota bacterium]|nr:cation:dicarboxylase symporter family transporter [Pseudomonadota bacterium]
MNKNLKIVSLLIRKKLWAQIVFAMTLGVILGLILSSMGNVLLLEDHTYLIGSWLKLPGSVFLNLIQMIVTPLVISSIILGICSSGDIDYLKKVGVRIIPYFTFTTIISVLIGLFLTLIIEPGAYIN